MTFAHTCGRRCPNRTRFTVSTKSCVQDLCCRLFYVSADLTRPEGYAAVGKRLAEIEEGRPRESCNRLFSLAVPPSVFEPIVRNLSESGLAPRTRTADE